MIKGKHKQEAYREYRCGNMQQRDRVLLRYLEDWGLMQLLAGLLTARFYRLCDEHRLKFFKGAALLLAIPVTIQVIVFLLWIPNGVNPDLLALPPISAGPLIWWVSMWRKHVKTLQAE